MAASDDPEIIGKSINIGPDTGEVSINDLFNIISREMQCPVPPIYYPDRPAEVHVANCSAALSRKLLGYKPRISLQDGIHIMAGWMRKVGPAPFEYNLPIEIMTEKTPRTWSAKEI